MYRRLLTALFAVLILLTPATSLARGHHAPAVQPSSQVAMFDTEAAAKEHCPSDVVVWLNTNSGIFHEKGMRWYGRTKRGAYVCRKEAVASGYRDTRNGQ